MVFSKLSFSIFLSFLNIQINFLRRAVNRSICAFHESVSSSCTPRYLITLTLCSGVHEQSGELGLEHVCTFRLIVFVLGWVDLLIEKVIYFDFWVFRVKRFLFSQDAASFRPCSAYERASAQVCPRNTRAVSSAYEIILPLRGLS